MFPIFTPEEASISFWQSMRKRIKRRDRKTQGWQPNFDLTFNYLFTGKISTEPWDGTFAPEGVERRSEIVRETNKKILGGIHESPLGY